MATESVLRSYGENQSVTGTDVAKGVFGMELGTAHSAQNIATGQGTWQDYAGMTLWMTPVHKINDQAKTNSEKTKTTEESTKTHKGTESKLGEKAKGEFEAYEASKNRKLVDEVGKKATEEIANNSNKKNGPCLTGVYDPITGKTSFGKNFLKNAKGKAEYAKFVEEAHPITKSRIKAR